ncbi:MAG: oxygen-insensitive NADPH nitroreductase [Alicyclobacillaceae bacterium]|nr:oxygen-insensitive NADPH nitroreductase [Alicyclobacillaceae bacterium]
MNDTIRLLQDHRSVRKYQPQEIPEEMVEEIVRSAQCAATSSNVQAYTIIAVRDPHTKAQLAELSENPHVAECSVFLVFCADARRLKQAAKQHDVDAQVANTELFIVATVDAALAAQNAAVAAESLGLGICYIGGIRNRIREVSQILRIPPLVYPVFGMTLGYPAVRPEKKPRLPLEAVLHRERYEVERDAHLAEYDETVSRYYTERTGGKRTHGWTEYIAGILREPRRPHMREYLREQGFLQE